MMRYILNDLIAFFENTERKQSSVDTTSPVEMLFEFYMHKGLPEAASLAVYRREVTKQMAHLPFSEQDAISCAVNALCAEQEKCALMEGIRLGARLILDLQSSKADTL